MNAGSAPLTPVMRQYREAKQQHPDGILLFRLGDFYEIFFEDAIAAAPVMGVTLTSRPLGKAGRAPMCGVPHHAWQSYAGKLLRAGYKVVICDQLEPPSGKAVVKREITRVLTPGTVVEEAYLEPSRSNHLVAAWTHGAEAGLAACDVSTGELLLCQLPAERLAAELERLSPSELLQPPEVEAYRFDPLRGRQRLRDLLGIAFPESVGAGEAPLAVGAAGVPLDYRKANQARLGPEVLSVRTYSPDSTMPLDAATTRNLELPALIRLLDRTRTPMGARRLREWLGAPLRDAESIELRLGAVAELVADPELRDPVSSALQGVGDLERLCARDGGAIRAGYDDQLDGIVDASRSARDWIAGLEAAERARTGIRAIKVGYNKVFGYYIEVSHGSAAAIPSDYVRKQTLTGAERYLTPELKEREAVVLSARDRMAAREQEVIRELSERVAATAASLREAAQAVGTIDAILSLALSASELGWRRPDINAGLRLEIKAGRHPLVEQSLPAGVFVANDLELDPDVEQITILTGPNMAGKSTYLRQCALIVLLAQCGSFVPAEQATIGLADRIFTRVGAHDDIASGMSTFMGEIPETAYILNPATRASLLH